MHADDTQQPKQAFQKTGSFLPDEIDQIPKTPGVYQMFDAKSRVIYVGKATNLRSRVRQYFMEGPGGDSRPSVPFIRAALHHIETIATNTEKEAFILENTLIKRHRPKYNILFRDDKTYVSVRIDPHEDWPRAVVTREKRKKGCLYFGPYTDSRAIRKTMNQLQKVLPLRSCSDSMLRNRSRPCILHAIGRCCAPCVGLVTQEKYQQILEETILFLKGRTADLVASLRVEMEEASAQMAFERAAALRDRIQAIEASLQKQDVASRRGEDRDVIGYYQDQGQGAIALLLFREGQLVRSLNWLPSVFGQTVDDAISQFIGQFYDASQPSPPEILASRVPQDGPVIEEWLGELRGGRVRLLSPQRGEKAQLLRLAERNARFALERKLSGREQNENILKDLQKRLHLEELPRRIECYDIATLQGTNSAGAKVAFLDAEPEKAGYRLFKIKWVEGQDDFAMMRETLTRRFRRALEKEEDLPDLVLIDGGRGQLNAAVETLDNLGIEGVALAGLVKEHLQGDASGGSSRTSEYLLLPGRKNPVHFPPRAPSFYLLQRARDEAHRFVNRYHRKRRSQSNLRSSLTEVEGIGPARAKGLVRHFGSLKRIRETSEEELAAAPGMNAKLAAALYRFLHE